LLYVTLRCPRHDMRVTPRTDIRPTTRPTEGGPKGRLPPLTWRGLHVWLWPARIRPCSGSTHRLSAASPRAGDTLCNCAGRLRGDAGYASPGPVRDTCGAPPSPNVNTDPAKREDLLERSSRLWLSWANGDWRMGCLQVKRVLPTRSGGRIPFAGLAVPVLG
jgi:hypothetical protein